ncbi:ABC transporter ATP-binding protein [Desulfovibrio inopinatus]|uniref:ABC transporter ATP-binding protein n=1 Tax=Desulfovibrio inopinatus TaxID=102109 RepID=UPI00041622FC|nr:ABC transporter ATP-binding protein [Desulfovibrio inopinatus]
MSSVGKVELSAMGKFYGTVEALRNIELTIKAGEYCCLLGPSGCGKSTAVRMISGHEEVSSGDILLDGRNITDAPPAKRKTALMFQNYALFPHLSCVDNVAFSLKIAGESKTSRRSQAMELLELVHMADYAEALPDQLSGGQQQRVALARALITKPSVILLDEPLSALDPFLRVQMRKELRNIQKELDMTFIHVTHSQEEAFALADKVVVMSKGTIQQVGTPRQIFETPNTPFVASFIGGHNLFSANFEALPKEEKYMVNLESATTCRCGALPHLKASGTYGFSVRADRIRFGVKGDADADMVVPATVTLAEYQGGHVIVHCKSSAGEIIQINIPDYKYFALQPDPGHEVLLGWDCRDMNIFPHT